MLLPVILLLFSSLIASEYVKPSIWPKPKSFLSGEDTATVNVFRYELANNGNILTLTDAFGRYNNIIFTHTNTAVENTIVKVSVEDTSEEYPTLSTDESYSIIVPSAEEDISISAKTVYGVLRALESLSQLVYYDFDEGSYKIPATPIKIEDAPRYPHRGMLLDTSRHFQPISFLQTVIDSLSYAKYNVLHWHVVDTQSFPFESKAYPDLWKGSYSSQERYSHEDIVQLVEYGRARGVKIMIEFDMPGHAASWCAGYPEICPSAACQQPLDPSSDATFPLINGLLSECVVPMNESSNSALFPYQLLHLGGDEVSYSCWETNLQIREWQRKQGLEGSEETYEYFVDKVAGIARDLGRTPVQWVEVFEHFGDSLDNNTVIHIWKDKSTLDGVLSAGYSALLSNQDSWYLDHLSTSWETMYGNEPTEGLSDTSDPSLILGGESCMWGETVDASDVMNTVWPRAAAVAEVLWTPYDMVYNTASTNAIDWDDTQDRLETFRCVLTQRGVAAAPVTNLQARKAPREPGSCYVQRRLL